MKYVTLLFFIFLGQTNKSFGQETIADYSTVYLEKLIATAKENYPRVATFENRISIAKSTISKEQLSWLDAFSFSYVYKPDNTLNIVNPTFFNGYQAAVSFNLSAILQKPANVKQAKESLKIAQNEEKEYELTLESEVKRRYFAYLQALNNLRLQSKMVSDIQNVSKDVRSKYEKSEITFDQYTNAQVTLSSSLQGKIATEAEYFTAKAALEELLTKKLEEIQ